MGAWPEAAILDAAPPRAARVLSAADRKDDVLTSAPDDLVSLPGHVRGRGCIRTLDGLAASG